MFKCTALSQNLLQKSCIWLKHNNMRPNYYTCKNAVVVNCNWKEHGQVNKKYYSSYTHTSYFTNKFDLNTNKLEAKKCYKYKILLSMCSNTITHDNSGVTYNQYHLDQRIWNKYTEASYISKLQNKQWV